MHAAPGDWVRTTAARTPVGWTDGLSGTGLPARTLGVVLERAGSRVFVELDAGWGTTRAWLHDRDVRLVRRVGGTDVFRRRSHRLTLARVAVAAALALPIAQFLASYLWAYHSFHGVELAFVQAALYGAQDSLLASLHQPGRALIYFAAVTLLGRFAVGKSIG